MEVISIFLPKDGSLFCGKYPWTSSRHWPRHWCSCCEAYLFDDDSHKDMNSFFIRNALYSSCSTVVFTTRRIEDRYFLDRIVFVFRSPSELRQIDWHELGHVLSRGRPLSVIIAIDNVYSKEWAKTEGVPGAIELAATVPNISLGWKPPGNHDGRCVFDGRGAVGIWEPAGPAEVTADPADSTEPAA